jgi:hypothetical protein
MENPWKTPQMAKKSRNSVVFVSLRTGGVTGSIPVVSTIDINNLAEYAALSFLTGRHRHITV